MIIDRIVTEVIRIISADPLAWLAGGARTDLVALSANRVVLEMTSFAKILALFLSAIFIGIIVFATARRKAVLSPSQPEQAMDELSATTTAAAAGPLRARWDAVTAHLDSPRESDWKVAVIEADKFMDDALRRAGFPGDSFGDRLMNIAPESLVSLDGVWWAHKIRNRLAHEADYFLRYTEAKQVIGYFEQALAELKLI